MSGARGRLLLLDIFMRRRRDVGLPRTHGPITIGSRGLPIHRSIAEDVGNSLRRHGNANDVPKVWDEGKVRDSMLGRVEWPLASHPRKRTVRSAWFSGEGNNSRSLPMASLMRSRNT